MKYLEIYLRKKRKRMLDWSLKQSLLWTQVSQLTFYIFVKVGYYPLLALACACTLNSAYNEVAFNETLAIMKENLCTKYTPFTYKYITLNEKLPLKKQNFHIFFLL